MNKEMGMLFTGGLESTTLLDYFLKNEKDKYNLLYIKMGYRWEETEYNNAKEIVEYYKKLYPNRIIDFNLLDLSKNFNLSHKRKILNTKDNVLPMRNLSLLTNAALFFSNKNKNINEIVFGIQGDSNYPDTSKSYFNKLENLISLGLDNNNFKLIMPFYGKTKEEIIGLYDNEFPIDLIFSCANPTNGSKCNTCYKCQQLNNVKDDFFFFFFPEND